MSTYIIVNLLDNYIIYKVFVTILKRVNTKTGSKYKLEKVTLEK